MQLVLMNATALIACDKADVLCHLYENYDLETVTSVMEAAKGIPSFYRDNIYAHPVSEQQLAKLKEQAVQIDIDWTQADSGAELWAHAISLPDDAWQICVPYEFDVGIGCALGLEDKMVSVEMLLRRAARSSFPFAD